MLRAILFDLDDTLFDHRRCARHALAAVHRRHACFAGFGFEEFERAHAEHLEALHVKVLAGETHIDAARVERFRRLLAAAGGDEREAAAAAATYRACYVAAREAVPGARALLASLRPHARIGIVSNNLLAEQREKMEQCGLDEHVDALIVSEEAGMSKPDPRIFRIALARLDAEPHESLMIGDSWTADVVGAHAAGIYAIWFNPAGLPPPDASLAVPELRMLEPADRIAQQILDTYRAHRN
jgi:putative hydrolase of the HAD superfamily